MIHPISKNYQKWFDQVYPSANSHKWKYSIFVDVFVNLSILHKQNNVFVLKIAWLKESQ